MLIEGAFPVAAPPQALLAHLFDAQLMASCLPGCEQLERIDDDRYRAVVVVAMAGVKARFELQVEVTKRDERNVWAVTRGEEGGRASTLQAASQVTLDPAGDGTTVRYRSDVQLTGRLGRFALGMMKKKAQSFGDEFAANLRARLEQVGRDGSPPHAPAADAAPPSSTDVAAPAASEVPDAQSSAPPPPPAPDRGGALRTWWQTLWRRLFARRAEPAKQRG